VCSQAKQAELNDDHLKLLYLIAKYATAAEHRGETESWIRATHLNVLIYEGTINDVFDFDYSPQSTLVGSKRLWMNVSQEGIDHVDDLRERGLLNGLRLSTDDLQPVTAFQVSLQGTKLLLGGIGMANSDMVDLFTIPPRPFPPELKLVRWEPDLRRFALFTPKGYQVYSKVTDAEEVSYVMSPYLIDCLMHTRNIQFTDNADRAIEASRGVSTIQDSNLSEALVMENVCILISEWLPFGSNQIVALNEKLGSADRCQGGLLTGKVDSDPDAHGFMCGECDAMATVAMTISPAGVYWDAPLECPAGAAVCGGIICNIDLHGVGQTRG
jgi:hypothetical protein